MTAAAYKALGQVATTDTNETNLYAVPGGAQAVMSTLILANITAVSEVQTVTITGSPTGGTFTLTYAGATTSAIAYNAAAATVQAALEALSTVGTYNAVVTGGPGPGTPWTVAFAGALAYSDLAAMTATSSLTGGSSPAVAIATPTPGSAGRDIHVTFRWRPSAVATAVKHVLLPGITIRARTAPMITIGLSFAAADLLTVQCDIPNGLAATLAGTELS